MGTPRRRKSKRGGRRGEEGLLLLIHSKGGIPSQSGNQSRSIPKAAGDRRPRLEASANSLLLKRKVGLHSLGCRLSGGGGGEGMEPFSRLTLHAPVLRTMWFLFPRASDTALLLLGHPRCFADMAGSLAITPQNYKTQRLPVFQTKTISRRNQIVEEQTGWGNPIKGLKVAHGGTDVPGGCLFRRPN